MSEIIKFPSDDEDEYDPADWWDDDTFPDFDCAMNIRGDCGKAGSEECDLECPYRDVKRN